MPESLLQRAARAHGPESVTRELSQAELTALPYIWEAWARPEQLPPPGDWTVWMVLAGRGFGKTRTGAEWVRGQVESGKAGRLALVAPTSADVRDVMVEGESGIMATSQPTFRPHYEPSKRRLTWPNGAVATAFSADEPDRLRGPQYDAAWSDEVASWRYPEAWDMLQFGLRLGNPQQVVTTTPRPVRIIRELQCQAGEHRWEQGRCVVCEANETNPPKASAVITRGSSYDNRANLAGAFFDQIIRRYEGTRLGQQEIYALVLDEMPGALWNRSMFRYAPAPVSIKRTVVAIDPAITHEEDSDETGIIAGAVGADDKGYVLADRSGRYSPDGWASEALRLADEVGADRIVAEANQGGEMVEHTIRTKRPNASVKLVHAARAKMARAEPIAALYEQERVFHVRPFRQLEDQCCVWVPGSMESPDRLDALVWAMTELMVTGYQGGLSIVTAGKQSRWK